MVPLRVAAVARTTSKSPDDALIPVVGAAYVLPLAPRETLNLAAYRARLGTTPGAWAFWESAPTTTGIASIFSPYGGGAIVVNANAAGWSWWSEFGIVWPSSLQTDGTWDSGSVTWDDGGLWDLFFDPANPFTAPSFGVADLDWLKREIRKDKGGASYPVVLAIGLGLDPGGSSPLWDDSSLWDQDPGSVWDTNDAPVALIPLGHVWGEEINIYGAGGPSTWDAAGDSWDDFAPPTGGW